MVGQCDVRYALSGRLRRRWRFANWVCVVFRTQFSMIRDLPRHTCAHSRPETRSPDDLTPALTQRHRRRRSHKRLWPCPAICYGVDRRTHLCGVHCLDVCVFNVAGVVFLMIACARVFTFSVLCLSLTVSALCCLLLTYAHVARFCLVAIMHTGARCV